ncbi:MAG: collagenase [Bacteroidetes bacterium 41-46]|nr:MAG: collagenase [Bacteroidetes bacterium 41-46]
MAPAGNFESLHAAIQGGADSIYFGIGNLNMRSHSANNFSADSLKDIVEICNKAGVKSYLTLNIVIYDEDIPSMKDAVDKAAEAGVSAIIASDMAAILYARERGVEVHISTQLNVSNIMSLKYHANFADVVVLARELTLDQVRDIYKTIQREQIKGPSGELIRLELFCHGALCMAVSGKCYLSLHEYNASANRGSCYQICRRSYEVKDRETGNTLEIDNKYIMSPKDLSTILFVDKIIDSGVRVFKIEGRARAPEYVKRVVSAYREAANAVCDGSYTPELAKELERRVSEVFNRGFWDGYYQGARLGEWSDVYGNKATKRKVYIAKVTNFFSNLSVAEVLIESGELKVGDDILIIGPSTGVVEHNVNEIRTNLERVESAIKGELCSISVPPGIKLRRSDKIYIWK